VLQLDKRRCAAPAFFGRPQILAVAVQAKRANAAEVVHGAQVVQLGERAQLGIGSSILGPGAIDHTAPPGFRSGVGDRQVEHRVMSAWRLAGLKAGDKRQVGRDLEAVRVRKPRGGVLQL